jgi:hypothetical protein
VEGTIDILTEIFDAARRLAWLVADGNICKGALARLLGRGFNKGCIIIFSSTEFENTLETGLPGSHVQTLNRSQGPVYLGIYVFGRNQQLHLPPPPFPHTYQG